MRAGRGGAVARGDAGGDRTLVETPFPTPDRYTRSGHRVGDICFECECRIVEIGAPEGLVIAWCECGYPEDHSALEIL
ncbi:MAG: hypothetical protein ABJC61_00620 [Acidobacteriota bacterium]